MITIIDLATISTQKTKVMLYFLFTTRQKAFNQLYITNKMERFSFKTGHVVQVAELIKED